MTAIGPCGMAPHPTLSEGLKEAGLVRDRTEGTRHLYRLHDQGFEEVRSYLDRVWAEAATRFRMAAENTRERTRR